jgi:hypothetical protein
MKLPMKVESLEVEPKGWGDNVIKVTPCRSTTKGMGKNMDKFVNPRTW